MCRSSYVFGCEASTVAQTLGFLPHWMPSSPGGTHKSDVARLPPARRTTHLFEVMRYD